MNILPTYLVINAAIEKKFGAQYKIAKSAFSLPFKSACHQAQAAEAVNTSISGILSSHNKTKNFFAVHIFFATITSELIPRATITL